MKTIHYKLDKSLIKKAKAFEKLRNDCKSYLTQTNQNFDKFTIVTHDSFIGYITEFLVKKHLEEEYSDKGIKVEAWDEQYDISKIKAIIKKNLTDKDSILYIKNYFYDRWDLQLTYNGQTVKIDVKTALTQKNPTDKWNFLYPVIQVNKEGKDSMILAYYVVDSIKDITSLKQLVIVGYTTQKLIKNCNIIKQGEKTRFGTISQIANYETELAIQYRSLDKMIRYILERKI